MARDLDRSQWRGQRPWFEIWFACILDAERRRALWIRQTLFVPENGEGRASVWGAWFDADGAPPARAAKRREPLAKMKLEGDALIEIDDCAFRKDGARGEVPGLRWDVSWSGGKPPGRELPAWLPAPTHAHSLAHDAEATAQVGDATIKGRALAMHLWGKRRVPTLHWIWAPWLGDASLEVTAVSLHDRFALGLSSLALEGVLRGNPATAAHRDGLVTATVAGARRVVHARAWAEPEEMVGYAYRDTDGRDLMVAQSDIASAHLETWTRVAPGLPWKLVDERRATGGVAVEIHQRDRLPEVEYIGWDDERMVTSKRGPEPTSEHVDWPELGAIVALGLTYEDHVKETGQRAPVDPVVFMKDARSFVRGPARVAVPTTKELIAVLAPADAAEVARRFSILPAVMDYEGELALVALDAIDDAALAAGTPQPFGLAAANDLTARSVQALGDDMWGPAKSFPNFLPVAPRVWAPPGGIAAVPELVVETRVNGETRQQASTKQLVYSLAQIVRAARAQLGRPLVRGDVILTGTPAGVGLRLGAVQRRIAPLVKDRFRRLDFLVSSFATSSSLLRPGDVIEVSAGAAGRVRARLVV
jgi:2-keto-4-pentenoate hydratase/2-oxohepta-3-ene-1,7-dioic acid hydratase in catechol pathway